MGDKGKDMGRFSYVWLLASISYRVGRGKKGDIVLLYFI